MIPACELKPVVGSNLLEISDVQLKVARVVMSRICAENKYGGLASNQVPKRMWQQFGVDDTCLPPMVMAYSRKGIDTVLVCPEITGRKNDALWIERCGSIYDDRRRHPFMMVERPKEVSWKACAVYVSGQRCEDQTSGVWYGEDAIFLDHEARHLEGETGLNKELRDPQNKEVWDRFVRENLGVRFVLDGGQFIFRKDGKIQVADVYDDGDVCFRFENERPWEQFIR